MSFEEIKERLTAHGISASSPRLAIADYVLNTKDHPTAEDIRSEVEKRMPSVSLATIYNTLNLFVEKGLIKAVKDPRSEKLRYDCNLQAHFHFYDEQTGRLIDLDPAQFDLSSDLSKLKGDFEISEIDVMVRGRPHKSKKKGKE